jgi:hypothetical protein
MAARSRAAASRRMIVLRARHELDLAHEAAGRRPQQKAQPLAEILGLDHLLGRDAHCSYA